MLFTEETSAFVGIDDDLADAAVGVDVSDVPIVFRFRFPKDGYYK
jgi:hypothetical protein